MTVASVEVARLRYFGNLGWWGQCGPTRVDVVVYDHGPKIRATYAFEVDGRHAFGGPAAFLDETLVQLSPQLRLVPVEATFTFERFCTIGRTATGDLPE